MKQLLVFTMLVSTLMLGACATRTETRPVFVEAADRQQFGFIEDIHILVPGSNGRDMSATFVGVPGAVPATSDAGRDQSVTDRIQVKVRLDSGDRIIYTQQNPRDFRNGDRVRIEAGRVFRN